MSRSGSSRGAQIGRRPRLVSEKPELATDFVQNQKPVVAAQPFSPAPHLAVDRDSYSTTALGEVVDRSVHAAIARFTLGISPAALAACYLDWATHLASAPGKQMQLIQKGARKFVRLAHYFGQCATGGTDAESCIQPLPQDQRFVSEAWQKWPYNLIYQSFLLQQQWWHNATTGVRGVTKQHENAVEFAARQTLDVFAPSNFLLTNPELQRRTMQQAGMNFWRGAQNFWDDWQRAVGGKKPAGTEAFRIGRDVAVTRGKVVYRNRLIELIQYAPVTEKVRPEPILIVPAWIMKYYVLDLSPQNSLVKYLTEQGFTVFMISWKNPEPEDRDLGMDDYRKLGVMTALDVMGAVLPEQPVHAVGYCIGGTLLSITAAAMAREGDKRLRSITLLAAQTDFHEAGELMLFINESQVTFLEDMMWEQGFLDGKQMAGAFQILRSNDLIWSRNFREYLMGERGQMTDLMAWNADTTRLPYRMHSEYLRNLYLNNDLAEGRCLVDGKPVALTDIEAPIFVVGTVRDHVAPWHSVHKIHLLVESEITFLLTTGGHNAGIVSEPGRNNRSYQVMTKSSVGHYIDPDTWAAAAPHKDGSWWPEWVAWLEKRSSESVPPPRMAAPEAGYTALADAPGLYILQE
jgi:poly[(R)-3-hydroxyalkanoate] polymerase subunit PhaC